MKKVTIIAALCIFFLPDVKSIAAKPKPGIPIGIEIVFGRKKFDCEKIGICKIQLFLDLEDLFSKSMDAAEERVGYGYASKTETSKLRLRLVKDYMTSNTRTVFFSGGNFLVEEDYPLSPDVIKELGLPRGYVIKAGTYAVTETSAELILEL